MPSIKFLIEDVTHEFDPTQIMTSEAIALEEDWDIQLMDLAKHLENGTPSMRQLTALVWLMLVRARAAEQGVAFLVAAKSMPAATFDVNLASIKQGPGEPENPTGAGTPTRGTRTTRATSAKPKSKRAAASSGPAT